MKKKKHFQNEEENNFDELRDLSKPMGQVLNNERTEKYFQTFKNMTQKKKPQELNKISLYQTNYSNLHMFQII